MTFAVAADSYDRFMGRYSVLLAPQLAALADVAAGQRVLDVGSGPGALTTELVRRVGAENVTAVDPSESFVAAAENGILASWSSGLQRRPCRFPTTRSTRRWRSSSSTS